MSHHETAVFAGGCFWCIQAQLQRVRGVSKVESGYTGGHVENPTYEEVKTGTTGHYEVVKVTFDHQIVSYFRKINVTQSFLTSSSLSTTPLRITAKEKILGLNIVLLFSTWTRGKRNWLIKSQRSYHHKGRKCTLHCYLCNGSIRQRNTTKIFGILVGGRMLTAASFQGSFRSSKNILRTSTSNRRVFDRPTLNFII